MFPVTIEGIRYPQHFKSQSKANAAAYEYFESIGKDSFSYKVFRAKTDNGGVYFVLQDNKGNALPLPEIPLPVRPSKAA
jgi:hypothetical protein